MHFFQLGGFTTARNRWDNVFRVRNATYNDPKVTAEQVFKALIMSASGSNVAGKGEVKAQPYYDPGEEGSIEEEITLTLGILPSGASVLLLTPNQVLQICSILKFPHPPLQKALHSSTFESLSPIEFNDIDSLTAKLRSLTPKPRSRGDTSSANKGYCQSPTPDLRQGSKRGLFENARLLRLLATGRISPPPSRSSSTGGHLIYDPYAQFAVTQNINEDLLPRIQVAAFAYTLWSSDKRDTKDRRRSPDLLDVAWARAKDGMRDLQAVVDDNTGGQQVDFGWNSFKDQPNMIRKAFPRSRALAQKDPDFGIRILQKLIRSQHTKISSNGHSTPMSDDWHAHKTSNTEHLILLVYDEPATRAIFLDYGVDLLAGVHETNSDFGNREGNAIYKWRWINDVDAGLKQLLRDDSYSAHDTTRAQHHPSNNGYNHGHSELINKFEDKKDTHRRSPSSTSSSMYLSRSSTSDSFSASPAPNNHIHQSRPYSHHSDDRDKYRSLPPGASERYARNQSGNGKRGSELKQEPWDNDPRELKRLKREPRESRLQWGGRFDEDGHDTTSEEENTVKSEPSDWKPLVKKEEDGVGDKPRPEKRVYPNATENREASSSASLQSLHLESSRQPSNLYPVPQILQIHVLDLKTLFHSSTGSHTGAYSVQAMARELQLGGGGVSLHGMLKETEYGSGWDAELMLSIFQSFVDGRTIDEQKDRAHTRGSLAKEEKKIQRGARIQSQSGPVSLDADEDPNDAIRNSREEQQDSNSDDYSDYGESD